jgi:hypothetical protein
MDRFDIKVQPKLHPQTKKQLPNHKRVEKTLLRLPTDSSRDLSETGPTVFLTILGTFLGINRPGSRGVDLPCESR